MAKSKISTTTIVFGVAMTALVIAIVVYFLMKEKYDDESDPQKLESAVCGENGVFYRGETSDIAYECGAKLEGVLGRGQPLSYLGKTCGKDGLDPNFSLSACKRPDGNLTIIPYESAYSEPSCPDGEVSYAVCNQDPSDPDYPDEPTLVEWTE